MASAAEQLAANMNFGAFQKATELHKRLWFTLIAMVVYRLGTYIPIPGINAAAFAHAFEGQPERHPGHVQHVLGRRGVSGWRSSR
jgi:preprotein translocase subunit SecY